MQALTARRRRALVTLGLLRAGATALLLVALYYVLPFDRGSTSSLVLVLVLGLAALVATTVWQVRAIVRSPYPGIRATQALATVVPLFLIVFATTYFMLSFQDPSSFSESLSRSDALYFTITTFATVGLGDVAPTAQGVRLLVAVQVLLDLVVLGLGIKVIIGAVRKGRSS
ncbi:ion channel [Isoptericola sp. F-RaC21]|uniref:ion channel n=1 Tax=Isoptericola sp. F-RaC21 TaxID=3141452 RepID=UPI00315BCF68